MAYHAKRTESSLTRSSEHLILCNGSSVITKLEEITKRDIAPLFKVKYSFAYGQKDPILNLEPFRS